MKNKNFIFTLVLLGALILSGFALLKAIQINKQIRASIPYLLDGEQISYFDLMGQDYTYIDHKALDEQKPSLILIFSRPCSPCNKNILYWKKMATLFKNKVDIYGIVLNKSTENFEKLHQAKLNFKIFIPQDIEKFIKNMRIKLNLAQTIVYYKNKVQYLKLGKLDGDEATKVIKKVRALI